MPLIPLNLIIVAVEGVSNQPAGNNNTLNVRENIASGTVIGVVDGFAAGENLAGLTFTPKTGPGAAGTDNGRYSIEYNASLNRWEVILVKGGNEYDYEFPDPLYLNLIDYNVTGSATHAYEATYDFTIEDAPDAPKEIELRRADGTVGPVEVSENAAANAVVARLQSFDDEEYSNKGHMGDLAYAIVDPTTGNVITNGPFKVVKVGTGENAVFQLQVDDSTKLAVTTDTNFTVRVRVTDPEGNFSYQNVSVLVRNVGSTNQQPTFSVDGQTSFTTTDTGAAVSPFAGITLADNEADTLTLTISFTDANGALANIGNRNGVTLVSNVTADGIRTYTLSGTAAALNDYLNGVTFDPVNGSATTTNFSFTVKDPTHAASTHNNAVNVVATFVNDAPTFSIAAGQTSFATTDTGAAVNPFAGVTLADDENDVLTLTISFVDTDGSLGNIASANGVTVTNNGVSGGNRMYTFRGTAADLQNFLDNVTFNPRDRTTAGPAVTTQFSFTVKDDNHTASTHNNAVNVVATFVNDAPTFSIAAGQVSFAATDTGPAVNPFVGVTLADDEGDVLTVTISFADADGALGSISSGGGVTVTDNGVSGGNRMYTFVGTAADLQNFLDNVTFNPRDRAAAGATVTTNFSFTVKDAGHAASTHNNAVNVVTTVVGPNDAPTFSINGPTSFTATDTGAAVNPFAGVTLADDENDVLTLTISFADAHGALGNVASANGVTVTDNGLIGANRMYTFRGTAADLQNFLDNVTFDPRDRASAGPAVTTRFSFTVKDDNHAASTHNNVLDVVTTVVGTNDAPTFEVDGPTSFTATDTGGAVSPFGGIDLGDDENDTLTLTISFADAHGTLENAVDRNGVTVTDNGVTGANRMYTFRGTAADLEEFLDELRFDPMDRTSAGVSVTTQFSFTVKDAGHAASTHNNAVNVVTTVVGANVAPVIIGAATPVTKTVSDRVETQPFTGLTIQDAGELTVVVKMDAATKGKFDGDGGVYDEEAGTFTISGTAFEVTAALQALRFDARDKAAGAAAEATRFTITVEDSAGLEVSNSNITVSATAPAAPPPVNVAPNDISIVSGGTVRELSATGDTVATLGATDPNGNDGFVYSIVNPDGRFAISGNRLVVANGVKLDFEQAQSHQVKVQVTDKSGSGLSYTEDLSIGVFDWAVESTVGSAEKDIIKGGAGKDTLGGGFGDDQIWGGLGNDALTGNAGKDIFVFDTKLNKKTNKDAIKDFVVKDDTIWLENKVFTALGKKGSVTKPEKMKKDAFWTGSKAHDANDRIIYDKKKGVLYYDQDGTGSKAAIEIATIKKGLKITEKDFFII